MGSESLAHGAPRASEAAGQAPAPILGAGPVTPSQRARRDRMLAVAMALAAEGGYDAVAMRDVAEQAGVALGTLYRYFPSKVHLLASALAGLLEEARDALFDTPPAAADPAGRVLEVLDRLVDLLEANRGVSEALIQAMSAADVTPSVDIEGLYDVTISLIALAAFGPEHAVDDADKVITGIIGKVFVSDLRHWLGGRVSVAEIRAALADTVGVVMAGRAILAPRPAPTVRSDT